MGGISHLKNRTKKLGKASFVALQGRRHSIVYIDNKGNILWEEGVNYNSGVLAVPPPCKSDEEWEDWCKYS